VFDFVACYYADDTVLVLVVAAILDCLYFAVLLLGILDHNRQLYIMSNRTHAVG